MGLGALLQISRQTFCNINEIRDFKQVLETTFVEFKTHPSFSTIPTSKTREFLCFSIRNLILNVCLASSETF